MMRRGEAKAMRFVILLLGGAMLAGCGKRSSTPTPPPLKTPRPTVTARLTNVHPSETDEKGRRVWEASAKSLEASEAQQTGELEEVRAVLYQEGKPEITVTAPHLKVDYKVHKLFLTGGVTAVSSTRKAHFAAGELVWNASTNQFVATGGVRMIRERALFTGGRMLGDTRMKKVRMTDHPRLTVSGP